jgi:hypothetical protein
MRTVIARVLLVGVLLVPQLASAQAWLPDRASREGPGVKLGDSMVFHPGFGAEGGYDTNPLRREDGVGAGRLRLTGYLDLATLSKQRKIEDEGAYEATPPKVSFRWGVAGFYDFFFTDEERVNKQDDFGIDTDLNFVLFPSGNFSLLLDAAYQRTLQPYESSAENWARQSLVPGLGIRITPGGGTLSLETGYRMTWMFNEDENVADRNDKITHEVRFNSSWKILPKTAIVTLATFSPIVYIGDASFNTDSKPVRASVGLNGLLTNRFGMKLAVGYGGSFYDAGEDFDSVIASGEFAFYITPFANIRLGGSRDFVDSFYSNFYVRNGGYLKYEQMFGGLFLASLKGDVYYNDYASFDPGTDVFTSSVRERYEVLASVTLLLEVRATDWLSFHASAKYTGNVNSNFNYQLLDNTGAALPGVVGVEYNMFEILAGLRAHY